MISHAKDHWKGIIQVTKNKIKKEEDQLTKLLKKQAEIDQKKAMNKMGYCKRYCFQVFHNFKLSESKIISYKSTGKEVWDFFILFLAIINSIFVPLELSF